MLVFLLLLLLLLLLRTALTLIVEQHGMDGMAFRDH